ncbi:hypothetical protein Z517_11471 [Fonsecaea pedrosoi CBS 271.37]|uniref:NACHT domain-containing protein n=1 Tax=Fonsecaea pedrosoi CBS 271.37 TaxID=1442368 RepID=A0A0D2DAR4_9EURO|nr:uncharacterized protein Z517_11471 [Fonsecaea pedrosoi CBS 271.37]KIW74701.1 hypothetical protein Z517_11471 [Fonsecaea pedrosoi CBS 271.37]
MASVTHADPASSMALVSSLFADASMDFKSKVPDHLVPTFDEIRTLQDLECAIRGIEASQGGRKSLRYLSKIKPYLKALDEYSKVIEVFVNAKPEIMAFVWGPIKLCLLIASKHEKAFDSLLSAYVKIKDALPHFSAVEQLFENNLQMRHVLVNLYKDILAFHLRVLTFFSRPGWSIAFRVTCRAFDDMFGDIVTNLERSKELFYSSASIAHYQAAQEARQQIEVIFKTQQETARIEKRTYVHGWLSPPEHRERHEQLCELRSEYPQTAQWIFEEPCWKNWLNNEEQSGRILWVSGIPGAGKTVIFSAMVESLILRSKSNSSCAVAYVYCKYNDCQRNSFAELARSLIHQLAGMNEICGDYLYDTAINSTESKARGKQALTTIIQDVLQCYEEVFIGIDGLDECEKDQRRQVLDFLKGLFKLSLPDCSLRLFLTSQGERDIEKFMALTRYHVKIGPVHLSRDILYYVNRRSAELARFNLTSQQMGDLNRDVSARCSEGMFLLARLIFDLFERCVTRADFDDEYTGKGLPSGIDEAYGRILSRVRKRENESGRSRAKPVLEILSCAKRKLYVHELQGMLSMDTTNRQIDFSRGRYTQHFKELCGPLVELNLDGTVDFAHQTVKDYLDQYHSEYVNLGSAAFHSAGILTSYLSLDCFASTHHDEQLIEAAKTGCFSFYKYAVFYWLPHIQCLGETGLIEARINMSLRRNVQATYRNLISFSEVAHDDQDDMHLDGGANFPLLLEQTDSLYERLLQNHEEDSPVVRQISRIQRAIEAVISTETDSVEKGFLKDAYGPRPYHCPALSCLRFHDGFSNPQDRDNHHRTHERPFRCSFQDCSFHSVGFPTQRILDAHVDAFHVASIVPQFLNMKTWSIWVSLQNILKTDDETLVGDMCVEAAKHPEKPPGLVAHAIEKGHFNSARALLQHFHGLDDIVSEKVGREKLIHTLAGAGELGLMRQILALCPSLQWTSREYCVACFPAINKGRKDMLSFLLDQACDRDFDPDWRPVALIHRAARAGYGDQLSLVLDKVGHLCPPNAFAICCRNIAGEGNAAALEPVLTTFLNACGPQAKESKWFKHLYELPIGDAVTRLMKETVGYSQGKEGGSFKSAFQRAALRGDVDRLTTMLDLGIDINCSSGQYGTALQAASKKGHVHVVRLLLGRGAQVGIVGGEYGHAVAAAAALGQLETLEILLAAGADASQEAQENSKKGIQPTRLSLVSGPSAAPPLHFAASEMQEGTLRALIEAKADIRAVDSNGDNALHLCVLGPCPTMNGKVYGKGGGSFWFLPNVARRIRHSSCTIAKLLLVLATAQNKAGNSPLHLLFRANQHSSWGRVPHPCAVQMAKLLFEAGASFDQLNNDNKSARDAAIQMGGQTLEDLKREIPSAWEGHNRSDLDCEMRGHFEPREDLSQFPSPGLGLGPSASQSPGSPFEIEPSYVGLEAEQWPTTPTDDPFILPSLVTDYQYAPADGTYGAADGINAPGVDEADLSSNCLHDPDSELLTNHWQDA